MKNNSVICLNEELKTYKVPEYILGSDTLDHADIGWVDQMLPFIESYTKKGHNVLDIFAGLGSTAIAAKILNRNAYMIEIETIRSQLIKKRWEDFSPAKLSALRIFNHDTLSILKQTNIVPPIHLAITNTPYFSVNPRQVSQQPNSLYNAANYEDYLGYIEKCLIELRKHLAGGATCIMTCENIRNQRGELVPLAWDIAKIMQKHYVMFDEKILYYPNTQRAIEHPLHSNRQHEYVFITKKYLSLKLMCADKNGGFNLVN